MYHCDYRELKLGDIPRCVELEYELFEGDDPWSAHSFKAEILSPRTRYIAAIYRGELVGYGGIGMLGPFDDPEYEIHTIGVDPLCQGLGIGREIMDQLLKLTEEPSGPVFLEVRTDNEPALGLYRSLGFEIIGKRQNYYRPSGADAYTMMLPATEPGKGE